MEDTKKKRNKRRILVLFLSTGFTVVLLIAVAYAWFIGFGEVSVSTFQINIGSKEDLLISLDGHTWAHEIFIDPETITTVEGSYEGNTNSWVGEDGLQPVSTSGDNTFGRLDIYEKDSMSDTAAGYKFFTSKIPNYDASHPTSTFESNKYIAFDIFLKNGAGSEYNPNYNEVDDEAIYLTTDSIVSAISAGTDNYGLQNSVRVAFVQIGRIGIRDSEEDVTPDIRCTSDTGTTYTSLCNQATNPYKTVIWEPNDKGHTAPMIERYNRVCGKRTGNTTYELPGTCTTLEDGISLPTYTVQRKIDTPTLVDTYDGLNYYYENIYFEGGVIGDAKGGDSTSSLRAVNTFTDTMKNIPGLNKPVLMTLAPNSITKIRVYVYIEGQDVDNYDFITNDATTNITFGFTKDRFESQTLEVTDINYSLVTDLNTNGHLERGDEIAFGSNHFIVMSNVHGHITALSEHNINESGEQVADTSYTTLISETGGWSENSRIDLRTDSGMLGTLLYGVSGYENKIKVIEPTVKVRLITKEELANLGCSLESYTCASAPAWVTSTGYWTESSKSSTEVWMVNSDGSLNYNPYSNVYSGVRPVIEFDL